MKKYIKQLVDYINSEEFKQLARDASYAIHR